MVEYCTRCNADDKKYQRTYFSNHPYEFRRHGRYWCPACGACRRHNGIREQTKWRVLVDRVRVFFRLKPNCCYAYKTVEYPSLSNCTDI